MVALNRKMHDPERIAIASAKRHGPEHVPQLSSTESTHFGNHSRRDVRWVLRAMHRPHRVHGIVHE